jgi:hypothetical protein
MNAVYSFQKSPRCSATSKRTKNPCMAPAVNGSTVCRFHGARGGAPKGKRNGMYRHGLYTNEARKLRQAISALLRQSRMMLRETNGGGCEEILAVARERDSLPALEEDTSLTT